MSSSQTPAGRPQTAAAVATTASPPPQASTYSPAGHTDGSNRAGPGSAAADGSSSERLNALYSALQLQHVQLQAQAEQLRMQHQQLYGHTLAPHLHHHASLPGLPPSFNGLGYPPPPSLAGYLGGGSGGWPSSSMPPPPPPGWPPVPPQHLMHHLSQYYQYQHHHHMPGTGPLPPMPGQQPSPQPQQQTQQPEYAAVTPSGAYQPLQHNGTHASTASQQPPATNGNATGSSSGGAAAGMPSAISVGHASELPRGATYVGSGPAPAPAAATATAATPPSQSTPSSTNERATTAGGHNSSHDGPAAASAAAAPPAVHPDERRQLIVKFLTQETTEAELRRLFARIGPVEHVRIICDRATGKTKGYGFVDFAASADAQAAVKRMRGYPLCGKRLKVSFVSTERRDAVGLDGHPPHTSDLASTASVGGTSAGIVISVGTETTRASSSPTENRTSTNDGGTPDDAEDDDSDEIHRLIRQHVDEHAAPTDGHAGAAALGAATATMATSHTDRRNRPSNGHGGGSSGGSHSSTSGEAAHVAHAPQQSGSGSGSGGQQSASSGDDNGQGHGDSPPVTLRTHAGHAKAPTVADT